MKRRGERKEGGGRGGVKRRGGGGEVSNVGWGVWGTWEGELLYWTH